MGAIRLTGQPSKCISFLRSVPSKEEFNILKKERKYSRFSFIQQKVVTCFFSWILFASSFLFFTLSIKWLRRVLGNKAERAGGSREHKKPADGKGQMYHSILSCKHGKAGGNEKRERETLLLFMAIVLVMRVRSKPSAISLFSHSTEVSPPILDALSHIDARSISETLRGFKENGWVFTIKKNGKKGAYKHATRNQMEKVKIINKLLKQK